MIGKTYLLVGPISFLDLLSGAVKSEMGAQATSDEPRGTRFQRLNQRQLIYSQGPGRDAAFELARMGLFSQRNWSSRLTSPIKEEKLGVKWPLIP